jgi:stress-induced morphogen
MVNQILSEEIKTIHGYSLKTKITKKTDESIEIKPN